MQTITTVGLDIAKSVLQVHCVDANGNAVLRRQLKRRYVLAFFQKPPPCLVGIEACARSRCPATSLSRFPVARRLSGQPPSHSRVLCGGLCFWRGLPIGRSCSRQSSQQLRDRAGLPLTGAGRGRNPQLGGDWGSL
jgi:hypothetical protein